MAGYFYMMKPLLLAGLLLWFVLVCLIQRDEWDPWSELEPYRSNNGTFLQGSNGTESNSNNGTFLQGSNGTETSSNNGTFLQMSNGTETSSNSNSGTFLQGINGTEPSSNNSNETFLQGSNGTESSSNNNNETFLQESNETESCSNSRSLPWKLELKPSEYLESKLSEYRARHERCAVEARDGSSSSSSSSSDCKFIVWISFEGLGNKMLSLTSAFVYALLTDRVLLVDRGADMPQLFCEPFPSWFLPAEYSHEWMHSLSAYSNESLGNINKDKCIAGSNFTLQSLPEVVYMHFEWFSTLGDKSFFCEHEQKLLQTHVKWLFIRANAYYVPALHVIPEFAKELMKMFPEPEKTFGTIARLVLQPTESIWARSMDYFKKHLAGADQVIGIQVRTFDKRLSTVMAYQEQLWSCLWNNSVIHGMEDNNAMDNTTTTNLLVTSLQDIFALGLVDKLSSFNVSGVKVHIPSHAGLQQTNNVEHDKQALEEMILLSMSDVLVTSPRSTFGYVPQGLSGMRPLTLRGVENTRMRSQTCDRSHSQDPGFLFRPPLRDCTCEGPERSLTPILTSCIDDPARCLQIVPV